MAMVRPGGFIEPCIPTRAYKVPSGPGWVHEIKHDGYRLQVRRDGDTVRLFTRRGYDWTDRYPAIAATAAILHLSQARSFGSGGDGLRRGRRVRSASSPKEGHRRDAVRFDLLELNGVDMRRMPLSERKERLETLLSRSRTGIVYNEHTDQDAATIFQHACKLGLEGIVSKRLSAPYRSGPSRDWIKVKNPDIPAMVRHREDHW
jgi:bifunctional non-homologous end joining protein LigD